MMSFLSAKSYRDLKTRGATTQKADHTNSTTSDTGWNCPGHDSLGMKRNPFPEALCT